uniref:NADH dehydrogenase subunit 3 n=1 Tax=Pseudosymplanella nigrifasciata TaxID=2886261 RepID=UPI001E7199BE|nr:NADH dehydrogenase subunit 3 [Pseudosymplanella nigrifasciata]UDL72064.1 NADH dehydrogenase subunit 3 [Pseudosymplanella nigrifasciata]
MKIFYSSMIILLITTLMFLLTTLMSKKSKMSREKNSPFECGFNSLSSPRKSFSTHFFLIATIFLIFDVEISLILPIFNTKMSILNEWMISSTTVLLILILGLMHEWKNGMLEWSK